MFLSVHSLRSSSKSRPREHSFFKFDNYMSEMSCFNFPRIAFFHRPTSKWRFRGFDNEMIAVKQETKTNKKKKKEKETKTGKKDGNASSYPTNMFHRKRFSPHLHAVSKRRVWSSHEVSSKCAKCVSRCLSNKDRGNIKVMGKTC